MDRRTSSRKGKRSGNTSGSTVKKSPLQGSSHPKCAAAVSDQPSADPSDKDEEQRKAQGFGVDASAPEGDARQVTLGFNVPQLLQGDRYGGKNNNPSVPPGTQQQQSADVTDDGLRGRNERMAEELSPSHPETSKPATTKPAEPEAKRKRTQGSSRDTDEQGQPQVSRMPRVSKSSVKGGRKSGRKSSKGQSGEAKKAAKVELNSIPRPERSGGSLPTREAPANKEKALRLPESITPLESTTDAPESTEAPSTETPTVVPSTAEKSTTSESAQQAQDPTRKTNAPSRRTLGDSRGSMSQAKRKQSGVSFDAGVKKPEEDKPPPVEHADKALVPLEEVSSKSAQKSRLSTILKSSTSATARRASTVDFGPEKCAFIRCAY
ncbi:hypothetical protein V5799_011248 [Amblyomma americanum]|uniref:Uncharacterized protein n=1 Tax=Amblyomma americanum TaxID=6943 RepID=A0AAQ4EHS5_AMBAM